PYLDALGQVVVAWRWLEQARVALAARPATPGEAAFHAGKRAAARYFFRYELPRVGPTLELLDSLDDTALAMPDDGW
ncbi:MAG: acyl-CoA dehydrogenase C-terminal domain-containing protein, partial [Pseudomonadota bacterium]